MPLPRHPIVIIPARLGSTRLPGKPLADIHGMPMIAHVWHRAVAADIGPVIVAAGEADIIDAIHAAGGDAVLTDPAHPSGSDRIHEALQRRDPDGRHDAVINVQGDLPTIRGSDIHAVFAPLCDDAVDIATLGSEIGTAADRDDPNVVKAVAAIAPPARVGRALYFTRAPAPWGAGPHYHHIGLYAYRRAALERFVALPPGILERRENLEQLRALEAGMRIDIALVDTHPFGVDTPAQLDRAREILAP